MSKKNKTIQFDYFIVWCEYENSETKLMCESPFDLKEVLTKAASITSKETTYPYRGEKARLQKVEFDATHKVWEIQLLRLREIAPPGLAKEDGTYELFHLEDGEYIGESVSLLYDEKYCVLAIQRNINAIPPSGVEEYFNMCIKDSKYKLKLKPKISNKNIDKINKQKVFKKIQLGLALTDVETIDTTTAIGKVLKDLSLYDGSNIKIEISVGRGKKDKSLAPGLSDETINELYYNSSTTKLKADIKGVDDAKVEKVDLFDDRLKDVDVFSVEKRKPITHERVYPVLRAKYITRRQEGKFD